MKKITFLFTILIVALAVQLSFAAPSLTITKPPVVPNPSWTGPGVPLPPAFPASGDPHAEKGQWFVDRDMFMTFTNCTHEFYDNVIGSGGGYQGSTAIFGYVSAITYVDGLGSPMTAFDITATIYNDISALSSWADGTNSHGEALSTGNQKMSGTLLDVKLTAEFSSDPNVAFPVPFVRPYINRVNASYIEAVNHDELAWYCWTDDPEAQDPPGNFHVPTWNFGSISMGGSATRTLSFQIQPPGMWPSDSRYKAVVNSFTNGNDILLNRTTSLKISEWIEYLTTDTGVPYPDNPGDADSSSDVSVFHNIPEPGIIIMFLLLVISAFRSSTI